MKQFPITGKRYTLAQIVNDLELDDSPFLRVNMEGTQVPLQTSHFLKEDLLKVEGWAELEFVYVRTTSEWIPLFNLVPEHKEKFVSLCDVRTTIYTDWDVCEDGYWITPKAFPRKQYYEERD
jgi:hypothetical protein